MKLKIGLIVGLVFISSCKQDPYPGVGIISAQKIPDTREFPAYILEMPPSIDCIENQPCSAQIRGHVSKGSPVIGFRDLPANAKFDASSGVLTYTPTFDVVDVSSDPNKLTNAVKVKVVLSSTEDSGVSIVEDLTFSVSNAPRPTQVLRTAGVLTLTEGQDFEERLELFNPDFPNGPFQVQLMDAPTGAVAVSESNNVYKVKFKPEHNFVKSNDNDGVDGDNFYKMINNIKINIFAPSGHSTLIKTSWKVIDQKLAPRITLPRAMVQGLDGMFVVRAEDRNGELPPEISLIQGPSQTSGRVSTMVVSETLPDDAIQMRMLSVRWDQLSQSQVGTSQQFKFRACSQPNAVGVPTCTEQSTQVTIQSRPFLGGI